MTREIYVGLKRPYAPLRLVNVKEFDNNEQAMRYAHERARKIYQEYEPYDSALVTKEEIREHPTDFGIYPLKDEDFFEFEVKLEYLHAMDNWLLFDIRLAKF